MQAWSSAKSFLRCIPRERTGDTGSTTDAHPADVSYWTKNLYLIVKYQWVPYLAATWKHLVLFFKSQYLGSHPQILFHWYGCCLGIRIWMYSKIWEPETEPMFSHLGLTARGTLGNRVAKCLQGVRTSARYRSGRSLEPVASPPIVIAPTQPVHGDHVYPKVYCWGI